MHGRSQRWAVTLTVTLCLTLASGSLAQTIIMPDAVPNLQLWLKADAGVEKVGGGAAQIGDPVAIWRNQATGGWADGTVIDATNAPTLEMNDFRLPDPPFNGSTKPGPVLRWPVESTNAVGFDVIGASLAAGEEATYFVMFDVSGSMFSEDPQDPNEPDGDSDADAVRDSFNRRLINFCCFRNYNKGWTSFLGTNPDAVGPFDGEVAYSGSIPITDRPHLGNMFWEALATPPNHFVDGTQDTMSLFYTEAAVLNEDDGWHLNAVNGLSIGPNPNVIGDIAEVIIYNDAISESDRLGVTEYFIDKYNLEPPFIPEPGDFNADTFINELDFDILRMNFLKAGGQFSGDTNGDGFVDLLDWIDFRSVFNAQGLGSSAIPEPGGMALLVLGGGALVLVAGRRANQDYHGGQEIR